MGRLIDADKCPCILCEDKRNAHCTYEHRSCEKFCNWLNNTAYDVDAVIDKLENIYEWNDKKKKECYEERDWEEFYSYSRINEAFYIAIETVKAGGAT